VKKEDKLFKVSQQREGVSTKQTEQAAVLLICAFQEDSGPRIPNESQRRGMEAGVFLPSDFSKLQRLATHFTHSQP